jgi:hypothetical protein
MKNLVPTSAKFSPEYFSQRKRPRNLPSSGRFEVSTGEGFSTVGLFETDGPGDLDGFVVMSVLP